MVCHQDWYGHSSGFRQTVCSISLSMPAEAIRMPHVHSAHCLGQSEKVVMIQADTCVM